MPTYKGLNALNRVKKPKVKTPRAKVKTGMKRPRISVGKRIKRGY